MWLEETVSPATSTSGTTRVSNSGCERSSSASPSAPCPKRKFSPDRHLRARRAGRSSTSSTNSSALAAGELVVERDHHELLHPEARDQVALDRERREQLRRGLGRITDSGCGSNVSTVSLSRDHLAVAEVHAVEGPDRDASAGARRARDVGEAGDLHAGANTTTGWSSPAARLGHGHELAGAREAHAGLRRARRRQPPAVPHGRGLVARRAARSGRNASARASGTRRSGSASSRRNGPIARALELLAVGVPELGDQAAHVGARRALDLEGRALGRPAEQLGPVDRDRPRLELRRLPAPGQPVGALAADLHGRVRGRALHQLARWAARAARARARCAPARRRGRPCRSASRAAPPRGRSWAGP